MTPTSERPADAAEARDRMIRELRDRPGGRLTPSESVPPSGLLRRAIAVPGVGWAHPVAAEDPRETQAIYDGAGGTLFALVMQIAIDYDLVIDVVESPIKGHFVFRCRPEVEIDRWRI